MGYLNEIGFEIYRLKEAKAENEFLIYNIKKDQANFYSLGRAIQILTKEISDTGFDIVEFGIAELNWDRKLCVPNKIVAYFINQEHNLINDVGFYPNKDKTFIRNNKTYFNIFNFPETFDKETYITKDKYSFEDFKKDAPNHYILFSNLHNYDDKAIKNTLLKLADKIHYPEEKAQDCIIFYPGEGSGKGIFFKYILQPIFGIYTSKVLMKKLNSDFNGFLPELLVLVLEEGKRDIELVETLKEAITEGNILINEKGKNQRMSEIYFLTFVFSNNMNPIDLGKRRGSYHLAHSLGKNVSESQDKGKDLCDKLPNETEYLLKYLHNLEFEHQDALKPFDTVAKKQVNDLNKSPLELFYDLLLTYPSLEYACTDLHDRRNVRNVIPNLDLGITPKIEGGESVKYIIKETIKEAYNNFCYLEGFKSNLIRHNKDIVQLWALFQLPDNVERRFLIKEGCNAGRKLDHIKLDVINKKIIEAVIEDENN